MRPSSANLLLLCAGAVWGMGFVAQATAMESIGPFLFVALRFLVATLAVLPFAVWETRRARAARSDDEPGGEPGGGGIDRGNAVGTTPAGAGGVASGDGAKAIGAAGVGRAGLVRFALIGLMLFGGMVTQQVGLLTTSVTNSGFLTGLYVVFTPLLAVMLFRERPHPVVWFAAALSLGGIRLLAGGGAGGLSGGDLLTIVSAAFWAMQVVLIARFVGATGRPLLLSCVQFAVVAVLAGALALVYEPFVLADIVEAGPSILYAGLFASGLAFTLQAIGQRYTTAAQAAIFLSSEAPFAALFGFLLQGDRIGPVGLAGCALILSAMLLVELVPMYAARRRARLSRA